MGYRIKSKLIKDTKLYNSETVIKKGTPIYSDWTGWYTDKSCKDGFLFGRITFKYLENVEDDSCNKECIEILSGKVERIEEGERKEWYRRKIRVLKKED